jgi:hypothetical protein
MNCRFARLLAAGLVLAASLSVGTSAESPRLQAQVEILVNGVPQRQHAQRGRWYIEALKGREYEIRLHNPYAVRVAVALSVDGLNTIDARETTANAARKWVLAAHETVTIRGWQTSRTEARRFEFTTEARSYGQALDRTTNLGVISAVFFKERVAEHSRDASEPAGPRPSAAPVPQSTRAGDRSAAAEKSRAVDEYAATGMGRHTDHAVTHVRIDLEHTPVQTVDIRYEFRPQLVRLGILPRVHEADPLARREGAVGFEPGFAPVPPQAFNPGEPPANRCR